MTSPSARKEESGRAAITVSSVREATSLVMLFSLAPIGSSARRSGQAAAKIAQEAPAPQQLAPAQWPDRLTPREAIGIESSDARHHLLPRAVEPLFISEITDMADGEVTVDVRRRTKQPDWTHDDEWSGSYPADLLADHRQYRDLA